jgi:hypothetical protein
MPDLLTVRRVADYPSLSHSHRLTCIEPSISRTVRVLGEGGWLKTLPDPGAGNRNQLRLTAAGEALVGAWGGQLEGRLAELVEAAGVPYRTYLEHTERLLAVLNPDPAGAPARPLGGIHRRCRLRARRFDRRLDPTGVACRLSRLARGRRPAWSVRGGGSRGRRRAPQA